MATTPILPKPHDGEYLHFGDVLRHYRETISSRLGRPDLPDMQVTVNALLKRVEQTSGIVISQASFSDVENGINLPRDPDLFLKIVTPCLAIEQGSLEWWTLVQYMSHGLIAQKLGGDLADDIVVTDENEIKKKIAQLAIDDKRAKKNRSGSHGGRASAV